MKPSNPIETLREQVFDLLIHEPQAHEAARAAYLGLEAAADSPTPSLRPDERFSDFIPEHVEAAHELATHYAQLVADLAAQDDAETPGLTGVYAAVEAHCRGLAADVNPDLLDYALMLFMTHSPPARRYLHGTVPPLLARQTRELAGRSADAAAPTLEFYGKSTPANEDALGWFRADPLGCEHHFHWHVVYPFMGFGDPPRIKKRQGELFIYMHTQMLARYDAERLAAKLEPVEPYDNWQQALPVAHDPGGFVTGHGYGPRAPGAKPRDVKLPTRQIEVSQMQAAKQAFADALECNRFESGDSLGNTIEANRTGVGFPNPPYYNYHNNGHVMIALIHDGKPGIMISTATATRDPIFWMWHKYIDLQSERWQDRQPPNDFGDAPPVVVGKPQVICDALLTDVEELERFASAAAAADAPSRLRTRMRSATIDYQGQRVEYEHLEHDRFSYVLPLHNPGSRRRKLTLRVWLAPEDRAEQRRAWIEMDKFVVELDAGERRWIRRADLHAAVIRKPAVINPGDYNRNYRPESTMPVAVRPDDDSREKLERNLAANKRAHQYLVRADKDTAELRRLRDVASAAVATGSIADARAALTAYFNALLQPSQTRAFCECGWPYHLLVPRGTPEGMRFELMVMATDWELDKVSSEPCCGSMSFCGAADDYPDKREMGYPFNRGFPGGLLATLESLDNVGLSKLVITFEPSS